MNTINQEIALNVKTGIFNTNYHDLGSGEPIVMVHGSGPGVTAWANWRLIMPHLAKDFRVIAPDMAGFGYSDRVEGITYNLDLWVAQLEDLLNALNLDKVNLVGNSFGGGISLAFAIKNPKRVNKLVLMGSVGVPFTLTDGLNKVWGYEPSFENMRKLMDVFAFDRNLVTDELAQLRYQASIREGFQESFSAMFPEPRQKGIEMLSSKEEKISKLEHQTLIIHGREDQVIPMKNSVDLFSLIPNSQLHIFGKCGHWAQIEHSDRFTMLLQNFFKE